MPDATSAMTQADLAAAFTEWKRRYHEAPDQFNEEWRSLPDGEYGDQAAHYLLRLLEELDS